MKSRALHSDLDAARRLGELKLEFVESSPIKMYSLVRKFLERKMICELEFVD